MSYDLDRVEEISEKPCLSFIPEQSEKVPRTIREQIMTTLFHYVSPETITIFLFGSLAENTGMRYSDIDTGVICWDEISDSVFLSLCDDLNYATDTLKKIDLVDFDKVDDAFREFALDNYLGAARIFIP